MSVSEFRNLSIRQAARALGKSHTTVARWECPRNGDGTLDLSAVVDWLLAREYQRGLADGTGGEDKAPDDPEANRRWQEARAASWEIKVANELGVFLRRDDVERQWGEALATLSQELQALPTSLATRLEGMTREERQAAIEGALSAAVNRTRGQYEQGDVTSETESGAA